MKLFHSLLLSSTKMKMTLLLKCNEMLCCLPDITKSTYEEISSLSTCRRMFLKGSGWATPPKNDFPNPVSLRTERTEDRLIEEQYEKMKRWKDEKKTTRQKEHMIVLINNQSNRFYFYRNQLNKSNSSKFFMLTIRKS